MNLKDKIASRLLDVKFALKDAITSIKPHEANIDAERALSMFRERKFRNAHACKRRRAKILSVEVTPNGQEFKIIYASIAPVEHLLLEHSTLCAPLGGAKQFICMELLSVSMGKLSAVDRMRLKEQGAYLVWQNSQLKLCHKIRKQFFEIAAENTKREEINHPLDGGTLIRHYTLANTPNSGISREVWNMVSSNSKFSQEFRTRISNYADTGEDHNMPLPLNEFGKLRARLAQHAAVENLFDIDLEEFGLLIMSDKSTQILGDGISVMKEMSDFMHGFAVQDRSFGKKDQTLILPADTFDEVTNKIVGNRNVIAVKNLADAMNCDSKLYVVGNPNNIVMITNLNALKVAVESGGYRLATVKAVKDYKMDLSLTALVKILNFFDSFDDIESNEAKQNFINWVIRMFEEYLGCTVANLMQPRYDSDFGVQRLQGLDKQATLKALEAAIEGFSASAAELRIPRVFKSKIAAQLLGCSLGYHNGVPVIYSRGMKPGYYLLRRSPDNSPREWVMVYNCDQKELAKLLAPQEWGHLCYKIVTSGYDENFWISAGEDFQWMLDCMGGEDFDTDSNAMIPISINGARLYKWQKFLLGHWKPLVVKIDKEADRQAGTLSGEKLVTSYGHGNSLLDGLAKYSISHVIGGLKPIEMAPNSAVIDAVSHYYKEGANKYVGLKHLKNNKAYDMVVVGRNELSSILDELSSGVIYDDEFAEKFRTDVACVARYGGEMTIDLTKHLVAPWYNGIQSLLDIASAVHIDVRENNDLRGEGIEPTPTIYGELRSAFEMLANGYAVYARHMLAERTKFSEAEIALIRAKYQCVSKYALDISEMYNLVSASSWFGDFYHRQIDKSIVMSALSNTIARFLSHKFGATDIDVGGFMAYMSYANMFTRGDGQPALIEKAQHLYVCAEEYAKFIANELGRGVPGKQHNIVCCSRIFTDGESIFFEDGLYRSGNDIAILDSKYTGEAVVSGLGNMVVEPETTRRNYLILKMRRNDPVVKEIVKAGKSAAIDKLCGKYAKINKFSLDVKFIGGMKIGTNYALYAFADQEAVEIIGLDIVESKDRHGNVYEELLLLLCLDDGYSGRDDNGYLPPEEDSLDDWQEVEEL